MREIVLKLQMTEKSMPIWQRIQKCAEQLTESGRTPFTRGDLIKCIQKDNPECGAGSIHPIIQGVTDNLKGGGGGIGKNILHKVRRGQFILNSNQEFPSSRPNNKYMPIFQSIQKCAEQLTESGRTPFTRGDLIDCIQKSNPERVTDSINSIIQGVTDNLKGGAGGAGKNILHSVGWGQFILNSNQEFSSSRPNKKYMPIWQRIQKCAEQLTESGRTPFTRGDLIDCIQKSNPECGENSIHPIIQGVTDNLKGGAGGAGKNILHSVGWGQFILNSNQEFPSSRPNKKYMPIWQHIKKCVKQLIKSGWTLFLFVVKKKVFKKHSVTVKKKVSKKHSTKLNGKSLELGGYKFYLICKIKLELDEQGSIKEYFPQNRYDNSKGLSLHKYGKGPFCKFKIESEGVIDILGVYVLAVNDTPKYVGECENLARRFNTGYGNISPRACFDGGQSTNCRINHLIFSEVKKGTSVELYFYPTEEFKQIEWSIRNTMRLDWNKV